MVEELSGISAIDVGRRSHSHFACAVWVAVLIFKRNVSRNRNVLERNGPRVRSIGCPEFVTLGGGVGVKE